MENRSRRVNLRIINIPEGSEKGQDPTEFISDLLMGSLGPDVLSKPPELERAHRSLAPRPGGRPRPFVICFHRFQEREKVLRWTRQHELKYRDTSLRVYPDVSAITAKKRAAFNKIKQALYQKGMKFRLLFPARLQVSFEDGTFTFETPEDAHAFYNERVMGKEYGAVWCSWRPPRGFLQKTVFLRLLGGSSLLLLLHAAPWTHCYAVTLNERRGDHGNGSARVTSAMGELVPLVSL
ncbi:hypothetical protein JOQ06_015282 [Pogonophryne albipinna]|uniref:Uncharacterized protein n=1 Tax=Pogonophryne albipinna TaxID=1090488 RepID=A0AAD6AMT7_9TELE|nr:hypothetical protein JOQ06_015282 [Pogonophryne albipinna]